MMLRSSLLLVALFVAPACQCAPAAGFTEADAAAIRALDAQFPKLVMAADWGSLVKLYYAPDAVVLPPNEGELVGHAAIEASFRAWPPVERMTLTSDDIVGSGDLAYSRGRWEMTLRTPGGPVTDKGKSLAVFRRQADGSWKSTRDTWNSDLPPPAAK